MFSRNKYSVGLDIGTQSVKLVKMNSGKDSAELLSVEVFDTPSDLKEPLKKLRQVHQLDLINVSVSGPSTVVRYVLFPKMNEGELRQALKFEAQKNIPFPIEDVALDGTILKDVLPDNKMLVAIAAVKKEMLNQRVKLAEDVGVRLSLVDMDAMAIVNAFIFNYPEEIKNGHKAAALLNIGASSSNLTIVEDGIPRLSRDIRLAGNNFTHKIMDLFSVDFPSAEQLKINLPEDKLHKITAAVESVVTNISGEVRTSFDFHESQSTSSVSKIFLSGGSAKFTGLPEMLSKLLGIEVSAWDPLKLVKLGKDLNPESIKRDAVQLAVAVGLALRK